LRVEETVEAFEDRTLRALFKISLREDQQQDVHGQRLIYLPSVRNDLEEQRRELRLEIGSLDQALLEAALNSGCRTPLGYLLPCWKRIQRLYKGFRKSQDNDPKFNVIREARRLCISYCIFAITMPEMFGYVMILLLMPDNSNSLIHPLSHRLDIPNQSPLKPHLLLDPEDERGVDFDFLAETVKRFDEDDTLKPAFIVAVEEMSHDLANMTLNDNYKPYLMVCRNVRYISQLVALLPYVSL
jgi:ubiquitin conjugation factor E4 B